MPACLHSLAASFPLFSPVEARSARLHKPGLK
uniref:Uncharacterized protein n=1 Tax=Picea glauca TaxID=3330 RepID=A0A117NIV5_PICGL|nr:hypothetical protein ABT39_MTgene412 [Picea glauca]